MAQKPSEEWLRAINEKFRRQDIEVRARPFRSLEAFLDEFKIRTIIFPSEITNTIFEWYYRVYGEERFRAGVLFRGVYYMDSIFWPIYIPVGYGNFKIDALDCVDTIPEELKKRIRDEIEERWKFMLVWVDCMDYAYGYDEIRSSVSKHKGLAMDFILAGDKELQAAAGLLLGREPNPKAIENCRMATEIFLKAILIIKAGWEEKRLKKTLGHDLEKTAKEVLYLANSPEIQELKDGYGFFPQIEARYAGREWSNIDLWKGYVLAQSTASTFTRMFSERDIRPQIFPPLNK